MATLRSSLFPWVRSGLNQVASFFPEKHGLRFQVQLGLIATLLIGSASFAQTPVILPNTISTIAGGAPTASAVNAACPTNAQFTATDAVGDGCPAVNATFAGNEQSMTVDPQGNVYTTAANSVNPQLVRKIDARTGIISIFADGTNSCGSSGVTVFGTKYNRTGKTGAGCPANYTTGINGATGLGSDPYGNIMLTTTGDNTVYFICTSVSPLCSASAARVNLMFTVAGCSPATGSYGTALVGTTVGTAGDGTLATQFTALPCMVGVGAQQRGVVADKWDNVYFMDASNGRIRVVAGPATATINGVSVTNPLYAALEVSGSGYSTVTQGFIYPMAGGGTACSGKTDINGDGCPYYQTLINGTNTGAYVRGVAVDLEGDFLFDDGFGELRVIYMGGTVIRGALTANGVFSPQIGYSYRLVGGGTAINYNSGNPGIVLGSSAALQSNAIQTLAVDPAGNVYIGDQTQVLFYDIATGYIRRIGGSTSAATCNASAIGDGCPITQALFSAVNIATPIGMDGAGNLYIQDLTNKRMRLVSASLLPSSAVNGTASENLVVHAPVTGSTIAISAPATADFTLGSPTCTTNSSSDSSVDCTAAVTFGPKSLLQRTVPLAIATTVSSTTTTQNLNLHAISTGSAEVFDTAGVPSTSVLGAAATGNTAVVLDGAGNAYVSGTQGISRIGGGTVFNITPTAAPYIAVDAAGAVYAAAASTTTITKYVYSAATNNYTSSTITIPTLPINGTSTQAMSGPLVVDPAGVIYLLDLTNKQVVRFLPGSTIGMQVTQTALVAPVAMTQDSYGQLVVVDGTSVYKIPPGGFPISITSPVANTSVAVAFSPALTSPTAVAVDQGGTIYVAANGSIVARSLIGGYTYTIPSLAGSSVAVDGVGNLYVTNPAVAGLTQVLRNAESKNFGVDIVTPFAGVFGNAGAFSSTGFNQSDTGANYTAATPGTPLATGAPTCNLSTTALAGGAVCNVSLTFSPSVTGSGDTPDLITLLPSANTLGAVSLDGTKSGTNATSSTAITGNTSGLIYSSGVETTFTVTVTQSTGTPTGTVSVQVDGSAAANYALTASGAATSTATVPVSGLSATSHSIVAAFANQPGIVGSTSTVTSFSIGQAGTTVSWAPAMTTQAFSTAMGVAVLDATATVPGVFVYMATPSGGSPLEVHSATYLPIGTYSLGVTFYPLDSTNYTVSTASVATYTVTKASTTALVGASQFLVAADGSGNFSSVQSAINALGASGGSVYIKPGTYVGDVSVVQPNVALRGLGGDPTKVILSHEGGAFSLNPGTVYNYAGEFNTSISNGYQLPTGSTLFSGDEGSATLVVAKGINTALSGSNLTPNNFYGENFTLLNTYDTDAATTTTTYVSGSACTANAGVARTYNDLFNSGIQCASQALAIWITSDLAVMNNVYTASLQDTIYAGSQGSGSNGYVPARQYWFRGKVTGSVDYIFGDAAAVFDHSSVYTVPHGTSVSGTATIEAQNKANQTGSGSDYLSGYIMNSDVFTSQQPGMTGLEFGRPYGKYSTWIMLNSYVDQVNPSGYIEFSGDTNLPTSTYDEYNNIPYPDPATNSPDLNGVPYLGLGGSSGAGVSGIRETVSTSPGTPMASNTIKTSMTQPQAQAYYPTNFLGTSVSSLLSPVASWNPTAAITTNVNAFVPPGTSASVVAGSPVTLLMRPQTPGLGAIATSTPTIYTIPTGTYSLTDSFNGGTSYTLASGTLDAAGEAYYTSTTLTNGTHNLTWTYGGDSNFSGSTTISAYVLTVTGGASVGTTTTLGAAVNPITYGQSASITATVTPTSGTTSPTGNVNLTIDGTTTLSTTLSSGTANFIIPGLLAGGHVFSATYAGVSAFGPSTTATAGDLPLTINKAPLTVTAACTNRTFGQVNSCSATVTGGYQYSDSAATVFTAAPSGTTTATRSSPSGGYTATPVYTLTSLGTTNYSVAPFNGSLTISGGAPQSILFAPLPNFTHGGAYQLTARATSGLPVSYSVTSGNASVSGSTLTVAGIGTVTVQASQSADPTGDYAPANPVSRSFTAQ